MRDGLYQVRTRRFCAGFVIENGKVTAYAPILRKNMLFWMKHAKPVWTVSNNWTPAPPPLQSPDG